MEKRVSFTCIYCKKGKVRFAKNEKLRSRGKNRKSMEVVTDYHKCDYCGRAYFDEQSSKKVAKLLDAADKDLKVAVRA